MSVTGFAVDLGGTKTAAARIENGLVVARLQGPTDPGAGLLAQIEAMAAQLSDLGFAHGDPLGVAVAGRVDASGHWHAVNTGTLRAISAAPLQPMLRDRFGQKVRAINDAAAWCLLAVVLAGLHQDQAAQRRLSFFRRVPSVV